MFYLFQDYLRDLEKEEEEQKKIQKVLLCLSSISGCMTTHSPPLFYCIISSLFSNNRKNWERRNVKTVMSSANWWMNISPQAFLQQKLTGVIIIHRLTVYCYGNSSFCFMFSVFSVKVQSLVFWFVVLET